MAVLMFYREDHRYTVDGIDVPSVSEITTFISRELYGEVQQLALDRAAQRGTDIHKATELLDKYGEAEINESITPYIKAYIKFVKERKPKYEKIEWVVNKETEYAGTLDRYGELDGKKVIIDIKSTSNITRKHKILYTAAQNLYRMAIECDVPVDELYILQLKKDETYRLIQLPAEEEIAKACLTLYNALRSKRRRKKDNDNAEDEEREN